MNKKSADDFIKVVKNYSASLIDVRTDMFCRSADEVTRDFYAVEKQK